MEDFKLKVVKINLTFDDVKKTPEGFLNIINNHINYYKKNDNEVIFFMTKIKRKIIFLLLFTIVFLILLNVTDNLFFKIILISIGIIVIFFLSYKIFKYNMLRKKFIIERDKNHIELNLTKNSFWTKLISDYSGFNKIKRLFNIKTNTEFIHDYSSNTLIFPDFAINYSFQTIKYFIGRDFAKEISYHSTVTDERLSLGYKYRKIDHQKWKYQRKDGGPDKRYSYNVLNYYYRIQWITIFNIKIEVESKSFYDLLKNRYDFDVPIFMLDKLDNNQLSDFKDKQKRTKTSREVSRKKSINKYDLKSLSGIKKYLNDKNIIYNDFGESIEFKIDDNNYLIDKFGSDIRNRTTFSKIVGGK